MSIVLNEHKINKNTNKGSYGTCNECQFRKNCKERKVTDYAQTVRCSEFKMVK